MKTFRSFRSFCALALALVVGGPVAAQEPPKPGPEHEVLKKMAGDWTLVMKFGGMESKGTVAYKMDLGELWLTGALESELFGTKFQGKSLDSYDPVTKKYVGVWVDSMATSPMFLTGDYDKATKTLTMSGNGPGMDGKPTKYKSLSKFTDDDTIDFSMYIGDVKEPSFTIVYKRKK